MQHARELFGNNGYHNTSIEEIYTGLGLTRGALYHHFKGKQEIFYEMCSSYNLDLIHELDRWTWIEFRKNWLHFLDLAEEQSFVQIWIKDLASVLSAEEMSRIDDESIGQSIQSLLIRSIQDNSLKNIPVLETSQIIIGMINQSLLSLSILQSNEMKKSKKNLIKVMNIFLDCLEK